MPRRREADPRPTWLEEVPQMGILFSDLVYARGVPDATLLLQFTYIGGRRPTGNRGSGGTDALPARGVLLTPRYPEIPRETSGPLPW
jgi:hypothetical protein